MQLSRAMGHFDDAEHRRLAVFSESLFAPDELVVSIARRRVDQATADLLAGRITIFEGPPDAHEVFGRGATPSREERRQRCQERGQASG